MKLSTARAMNAIENSLHAQSSSLFFAVHESASGIVSRVTLVHTALRNCTRDPQLFTGELNYTYDLAELGRYYGHCQALMAHWHQVLPLGRILDVRYEEVVANLEGMARRIVALRSGMGCALPRLSPD